MDFKDMEEDLKGKNITDINGRLEKQIPCKKCGKKKRLDIHGYCLGCIILYEKSLKGLF